TIPRYASKYASALYGPFREAVAVTIAGGDDRKGHPHDPRNRREAPTEVALDVAERADNVMVKPAVAYLDVIADVRGLADGPGEGANVWDVEGRRYTDYVQSWGASILRHAHPAVVEAVKRAVCDGTSFGAPTEREVLLAEAIRARVPSCERVRLVSSGTEATMSAVRVARGFTGRDRIVKFAGCYHGHADHLLAAAGSGVATLGLPGSAGV